MVPLKPLQTYYPSGVFSIIGHNDRTISKTKMRFLTQAHSNDSPNLGHNTLQHRTEDVQPQWAMLEKF
jgi:hypothetical protein